ncbi:MAG: VWA domain-containing protein, partial [bacterium]
MQFELHSAIWFFWLVPILLILFVLFEKKRKAVLYRLFSPALLRERMPDFSSFSYILRFILLLLAVVFLGLALLKPYTDYEMREIKRKGVDIYFLVDVSQSMMAQDIKPNRMMRARREIIDFMKNVKGDRVGLIGFAGESFVFVPLTGDYAAFRMFINELKPEAIPVQGTDIRGAIEKAVKSFRTTNASHALILITDGEDSIGLTASVIDEIKKQQIKVFIIGMGSTEGAPIPLADGGYFEDNDGKIVMSKLDENVLKQLAMATGGGYVRSVTGDLDLEQIYYQGIKKTFDDVELEAEQKKLPVYVFQYPLLIAILLLFLEILITNKRRYWRSKFFKSKKLMIIFFCLLGMGLFNVSTAYALNPFAFEKANKNYDQEKYQESLTKYLELKEKDPENPELHYNLGATYYKLNDYDKARGSFEKALNTKETELRAKTLFNLGDTYFKQEDLKTAIDYYEKAMQTKENYDAAIMNYEFVKKKLEEQEKQQQQDKQDQSDKSDKSDKSD